MKIKPIVIKSFRLSVIAALVLSLSAMSYFAYRYFRDKKHFKDIYDNKNRLVYLSYGLPPVPIRQNAERVTANRWGFTYKRIAGCLVDNELLDSANVHNSLVSDVLRKRYGKRWVPKFDAEVDAEDKLEQKINDIARNLTYIEKTQARLRKEGNGLQLKMDPISGTTQYEVAVAGWLTNKKEPEWVNYYRLRVDYQSGNVTLISDKIEEIK